MKNKDYFWAVSLTKDKKRLVVLGPYKTKPEARTNMREKLGKGIVFKSAHRILSKDVLKQAKRYAKRLTKMLGDSDGRP